MIIHVLDAAETGKNIKELRKRRGLTTDQLAYLMGFESNRSIYKWQNGEAIPTTDNLVLLAGFLGASIDSILAYREEEDERSSSFHLHIFLDYFATPVSVIFNPLI